MTAAGDIRMILQVPRGGAAVALTSGRLKKFYTPKKKARPRARLLELEQMLLASIDR